MPQPKVMQPPEAFLRDLIGSRQFVTLTHLDPGLLVLPRALARKPSGMWLLSQEVEDKGTYVLLDRWRIDRVYWGFGAKPMDGATWTSPLLPIPAVELEKAGEIVFEAPHS